MVLSHGVIPAISLNVDYLDPVEVSLQVLALLLDEVPEGAGHL